MKKAQGLPLNVIIIAAIVLIVLVVLWAIFTGRMGKFTSGLKTEEEKAQKKAEEFEKMAVGGEEGVVSTKPANCVVDSSSRITGTKPCMCGMIECNKGYCFSAASNCYDR